MVSPPAVKSVDPNMHKEDIADNGLSILLFSLLLGSLLKLCRTESCGRCSRSTAASVLQ